MAPFYDNFARFLFFQILPSLKISEIQLYIIHLNLGTWEKLLNRLVSRGLLFTLNHCNTS